MMTLNIQLPQQTLLGICGGLATLLAITFMYCAWQWQSDWALAHEEVQPTSALVSIQDSTSLINDIPNEHIFGQASGDVPITSLQLRVTGIVKINTEEGGSYSKAYISISGQPSKIYQTGDSLPYGVKVYDITSDTVILENDGRLEKLPMPRQQLEFKPRNTEERF